jgi:hypothetical protein
MRVAKAKRPPRGADHPRKTEVMRKPRRPSIKTMIEQAKEAGRPLVNIVLADGTTLNFNKPSETEDTPEGVISKL